MPQIVETASYTCCFLCSLPCLFPAANRPCRVGVVHTSLRRRDNRRPSARSWARQLGISHVWLLKTVRALKADAEEVRRLQAYGDPTLAQLSLAQEYTREMKERGELRPCGNRGRHG